MYFKTKSKKCKRLFSLLLVLTMLLGSLPSFATNNHDLLALDNGNNKVENSTEKISSEVKQLFNNDKELIDVLVYMKDKADVFKVSKENAVGRSTYSKDLSSRKAVINALDEVAERSQANLLTYVEKMESSGKAEYIESFSIANIVHLKASQDVIEDIAKRSEVAKIYLNETIELDPPIKSEVELEANSDDIEWNIKHIGADNVWNKLDIDGTGIVVGIIDSGVQWNHPALKEKWRGYNSATGETTAEGNWFDPINRTALPTDPTSNHGSHVAGSILGQEADGTNAIGVAPGAKWIAANAFTGPTAGTNAVLLACADWMLAPGGKAENAPDIVNNSWGGGANTSDWFVDVVDSWRAAGILPVFAAGNQKSGEPEPWPGSIQNPASLLTSFAVAATDSDNIRGYFSKLGPSLFDKTGKVIKPDISAPGVNIRSSYGDGTYGTMDGTSMASPHVAGVAALIKSANTSLTIEEIENLIKETAIPLTDGDYPNAPNMGYGYGLVNPFDAVAKVLGNGQGTIEGNVYREGEDLLDPVINHKEIEDLYIGEKATITANIKDDVAVTKAILLIKNNDMNEYQEIEMQLKSGDPKDGLYEAIIPGEFVIDGGIDYKIKAIDYGNNEVTTTDYRVNIIIGIERDKYTNDFESNIRGWELSGEWEWGEPTSFSGPDAKSGTKVIGTKIASYDTTKDILSEMIMPPIDLRDTEIKSASLEFSEWTNISDTHKAQVLISSDNGKNWEEIHKPKFKTNGKWEKAYINLSDYIGSENALLVKFKFDTNAPYGYSIGWYIDDIILNGYDITPPSIPTGLKLSNDINGVVLEWNKVVDSDLKEYNIYRSEDPSKDYERVGKTKDTKYTDTTVKTNNKYYYAITATDFAGNESDKSQVVEHKYVELEKIFFENFTENDGGLTTGVLELEDSWKTWKNEWEWGVPSSGPGSALTGTKVWATKLTGNYSWDHSGYIDTPTIDLPADVDAMLYVDQWLHADDYLYDGQIDYANIQVSVDNGDSWTVLGENMSGSRKWETISRDLKDYKGESIKLRFYFFSNGIMQAPGWYIDSVYVLPKSAGQSQAMDVEVENKLENKKKDEIYATIDPELIIESEVEAVLPVDATITVLETNRSVRTNLADGSFKMKHAASQDGKPWTLLVEAYGYNSKELRVDLKEDDIVTNRIVLEAKEIGSIKGKVVNEDDNSPIANAKIRVMEEPGLDIISDESGNFLIESLYEGDYTLKVTTKDHYSSTIVLKVKGNEEKTTEIKMKKFISSGMDEIAYDDGTYEAKSAFVQPGAGFAVRFTPERFGRLDSAKIFFVDDHDTAKGDEINIGVVRYNEKGDIVHFAPMKTIVVEPGDWNIIDLTEFDVMTDEDFYIVTYQIHPIENTPVIGRDNSSTANRSYVFNGGSLVKLNGADGYNIEGGMLMRAIMEYPLESQEIQTPMVTNLEKINYVNDEFLTIEGTVAEDGKVNLYLDDILIKTVDSVDREFSIEIELTKENNSLSLDLEIGENLSAKTDEITVILDKVNPVIEITKPEENEIFFTPHIEIAGKTIEDNLENLNINGEAVLVDENGEFKKGLVLVEGENEIIVTAIDKAGNESVVKRNVTYINRVNPLEKPIKIDNASIQEIGNEFVITFNLENRSQENMNFVAIVKAIDKNGRAYRVVYRNDLIEDKGKEMKFILDGSKYRNGISKATVYVWDNFDNMRPLSEVVQIN